MSQGTSDEIDWFEFKKKFLDSRALNQRSRNKSSSFHSFRCFMSFFQPLQFYNAGVRFITCLEIVARFTRSSAPNIYLPRWSPRMYTMHGIRNSGLCKSETAFGFVRFPLFFNCTIGIGFMSTLRIGRFGFVSEYIEECSGLVWHGFILHDFNIIRLTNCDSFLYNTFIKKKN